MTNETPEWPETFIIEHYRMGPTVRWGSFTLDEALAWQRDHDGIGVVVGIHAPGEGTSPGVWNSTW